MVTLGLQPVTPGTSILSPEAQLALNTLTPILPKLSKSDLIDIKERYAGGGPITSVEKTVMRSLSLVEEARISDLQNEENTTNLFSILPNTIITVILFLNNRSLRVIKSSTVSVKGVNKVVIEVDEENMASSRQIIVLF